MLKRWLRCLPAGFLLAALVLLLLWLNQPRSFSEVAGIEENTVFSVYTTAETPQRELMMASAASMAFSKDSARIFRSA